MPIYILLSIFAVVQARSRTVSTSIDPRDPESDYFHPDAGEPLERPASGRLISATT
jgi:hypothetical protein